MNMEQIAEQLAQPTPPDEVYFYPGKVVGAETKSPKALCVPYVMRQFVEDRLDNVVGAFGWQTEIRAEASVLCYGIGVMHPESSLWLWKWDTGAEGIEDAKNQSITGGIKRAGRLWGIGRDVSRLVAKWRACKVKDRRGKMVFDEWETEPTLDELASFTRWIRKIGAVVQSDDKDSAGGHADKSDSSRAAPAARSGQAGLIGGDSTSQFWYTARGLVNAGALEQAQVEEILSRHMDSTGRQDFAAAKAELDQHVPPTPEPVEEDEIPF